MTESSNIAPRRLHEQVLAALLERIVVGEFSPGAALPSEAEMCATYGVSRSSVREALRVLAEKGLIEVRHGLGTRVNPPERWDFLDALVLGARRRCGGMAEVIGDLLEALRIVECEAAALAAQRAEESHRVRMESALERMRASRHDPDAFGVAVFAFHETLLDATKNYVLRRWAEPIRELLQYTVVASFSKEGSVDRALGQHEAVYQAVCDADADSARDVIRAYLETMARDLPAPSPTPAGVG
ncbi:MAG: FadR/GntR family transcriptional regulator [Vulcanimicrobiaceae bacterium]